MTRTYRRHRGLFVRYGSVGAGEVVEIAGCRVTSAVRTAWDLARRLPLVEAVVAVVALARAGGFEPAELLARWSVEPGARGCRRLGGVVRLADPRAESRGRPGCGCRSCGAACPLRRCGTGSWTSTGSPSRGPILLPGGEPAWRSARRWRRRTRGRLTRGGTNPRAVRRAPRGEPARPGTGRGAARVVADRASTWRSMRCTALLPVAGRPRAAVPGVRAHRGRLGVPRALCGRARVASWTW
jgi:hypothetical protein